MQDEATLHAQAEVEALKMMLMDFMRRSPGEARQTMEAMRTLGEHRLNAPELAGNVAVRRSSGALVRLAGELDRTLSR